MILFVYKRNQSDIIQHYIGENERIVAYRWYNKSTKWTEWYKFSFTSHYHDTRYYTRTDCDNRYAPKIHDHNSEYYTKKEVDAKIPSGEGGV